MAVLDSVGVVLAEIEPIGWREQDRRRREAAGDPFVALVKREALVL